MGWAVGWDSNWGRDIGYGVPAICDYPGCGEKIDRGLGYVCGSEPYGGECGCGLYFCNKHLYGEHQQCWKCIREEPPFDPKPDTAEWTNHKMTDPSWAQWRRENGLET